jgi:hypothetical protein
MDSVIHNGSFGKRLATDNSHARLSYPAPRNFARRIFGLSKKRPARVHHKAREAHEDSPVVHGSPDSAQLSLSSEGLTSPNAVPKNRFMMPLWFNLV